jgi:hypothetical protein
VGRVVSQERRWGSGGPGACAPGAFVARYADEPTSEALRRGGVNIEFLDYDWSLNGR